MEGYAVSRLICIIIEETSLFKGLHWNPLGVTNPDWNWLKPREVNWLMQLKSLEQGLFASGQAWSCPSKCLTCTHFLAPLLDSASWVLAVLTAGSLLSCPKGRAGLPLSIPSNSLDVSSEWTTVGDTNVLTGLALVLGSHFWNQQWNQLAWCPVVPILRMVATGELEHLYPLGSGWWGFKQPRYTLLRDFQEWNEQLD